MIFQSFMSTHYKCMWNRNRNENWLLVSANNLKESWCPRKYEIVNLENIKNRVCMKELWFLHGVLQCISYRLYIKNKMWISRRNLNESFSTRQYKTSYINNVKKWSSYAKFMLFWRFKILPLKCDTDPFTMRHVSTSEQIVATFAEAWHAF